MEYTKKTWNENHKRLKELFKKEITFRQGIDIFMEQHARVHSANVSGVEYVTFEDSLWEGMTETAFRMGQNKKGRTVAYGMWHSARVEDITMNLLVAGKNQIIDKDNWMNKIKSPIYDTGNELTSDEILNFSKEIDMQSVKDYRDEVGKNTRNIVSSLTYKDINSNIIYTGLDRAISLGAVSTDEEAIWLIDYWRKKNVLGILLMPATRHNLVHINESLDAKKRGLKIKI